MNVNTAVVNAFSAIHGDDLAEKLEECTLLLGSNRPRLTNGNAVVNVYFVASVLPQMLRDAYKRLAYTYVAERPVADALEGEPEIIKKMRDELGPDATDADRLSVEAFAEELFEGNADEEYAGFAGRQEPEGYRPDRAEAAMDVALLEKLRDRLIRVAKELRWLRDGIAKPARAKDGTTVFVTEYPCPKNYAMWRAGMQAFFDGLVEPGRSPSSLEWGIAESGPFPSIPSAIMPTAEFVEMLSQLWMNVGQHTLEEAGRKAAAALIDALAKGDKVRVKGALKKWELIRCSEAGTKLIGELVQSPDWEIERDKQYSRKLERLVEKKDRVAERAAIKARIEEFEMRLAA